MKDPVRFSILVPVYNVQDHLKACVESILCQSFPNYEVILLNDGSTDNSGELCDACAKQSPRARVVHQENAGQLQTRWRLLAQARGEFVWFVDSDDFIREDALTVLNQGITESGADLVVFKFTHVYATGKTRVEQPLFEPNRLFQGKERAELHALMVSSDRLNSMCRKVMRTELVRSDINYESFGRLQYSEDLLQSLHPLDQARRVLYLDEALYFYRHNPQSITWLFNPQKWTDIERVTDVVLQYASKWDLPEPVVRRHFLHRATGILDALIRMVCGAGTITEQRKAFMAARDHKFTIRTIERVGLLGSGLRNRTLWALFVKRQFALFTVTVRAWKQILQPVKSHWLRS
jgi:glycosyltransferase involved in cell wall biosynthesis